MAESDGGKTQNTSAQSADPEQRPLGATSRHERCHAALLLARRPVIFNGEDRLAAQGAGQVPHLPRTGRSSAAFHQELCCFHKR